MELQYCEKCISMTNHDERSGQCLRCKSIQSKLEPQPEGANAPKLLPAVIGCDLVVINCADRLPDKPGHYLVYAPTSFPKNCKWVVAEFYDDNNTFYSESNDMPLEDVTHWTTLPEYPNHGR